MADKAHRMTDEKLEEMERHLSAIYSRAHKEYLIEANVYTPAVYPAGWEEIV